ncbi:MAG: hypothetical protein M1299_13160 [Firmicutes bacterium]|nr:hypothetical protein [Bacillota bacterium]MCL5040738.1 hypothetical protein [Bacillota bacterium]
MVFRTAEELYECLGGFMWQAGSRPDIGAKIKESGLIIRFIYHEPEAQITINAKNPSTEQFFDVINGESPLEPNLVFSMKGDVAHKFWLGKLNLTLALTNRQISLKGSLLEAMKLLPAIQPAYALYPEYLKSIGREDILAG